MKIENIKLHSMYFLDTLSFAMTVSTIPPFLIKIGGNHFILGIFGSGSVLCQMLAAPFLKTACDLYGKKYSLLFCSIWVFILSLNLIILNSCWSIVLNRWLFAFANHAQTLQKSLILDKPNKDMINSFISTLAFVVGPVTSGYLFEKKSGITYIFFISATLYLINILASMTVKLEVIKEKPSYIFMDAVFRKMGNSVYDAYGSLKRCHYLNNWDLLLLKCLMVANATVLFTKFAPMLIMNYGLKSFLIGCTSGYQTILIYAAAAFTPFVKRNAFASFPNIRRLIIWCSLFLIGLVGICYGPSHYTYLITYVPMIFGRSLVDSIWLDLAVMRGNSFLLKAADVVATITRLVVPLSLGILSLLTGPSLAIKLCIILPVLLMLGIIVLQRRVLDIVRRLSTTQLLSSPRSSITELLSNKYKAITKATRKASSKSASKTSKSKGD